jgi:hypothetical protein
MDEAGAARRPTRFVLAGVALFVVAVVLARLLLVGGKGWLAFAAAVPILLLVVTARSSFPFALGVTALFTVAVFALKWLLQRSSTGWVALLLLPVVAFTAVLVGRVLGQLRAQRRQGSGSEGGGTGPEAEAGAPKK